MTPRGFPASGTIRKRLERLCRIECDLGGLDANVSGQETIFFILGLTLMIGAHERNELANMPKRNVAQQSKNRCYQ